MWLLVSISHLDSGEWRMVNERGDGKGNWKWERGIPHFGMLKLPSENGLVVLYLSSRYRAGQKKIGKEGIFSCRLRPITHPLGNRSRALTIGNQEMK